MASNFLTSLHPRLVLEFRGLMQSSIATVRSRTTLVEGEQQLTHRPLKSLKIAILKDMA